MKRRWFLILGGVFLAINLVSCDIFITQDKTDLQTTEEASDSTVSEGEETVVEADFTDCKSLEETNQASDAMPIKPGCYSGDLGADLPSGSMDKEDWYTFDVQPGQIIQFVLKQPEKASMTLGLFRPDAKQVGKSSTVGNIRTLRYAADVGGTWWIKIVQSSGAGEYLLEFNIMDQNDAGSGGDAGNASEAYKITPGSYEGYLKSADDDDWYTFDVQVNKNIHVELTQPENASISFSLIRPNSKQAGSAKTIGDVRSLTHIADVGGAWFIKVHRGGGEGTYKFVLDITD